MITLCRLIFVIGVRLSGMFPHIPSESISQWSCANVHSVNIVTSESDVLVQTCSWLGGLTVRLMEVHLTLWHSPNTLLYLAIEISELGKDY